VEKIEIQNKEFFLKIERKKIKRLIIKVVDKNTIGVSAPFFLDKEQILFLVKQKNKWITKTLSKIIEKKIEIIKEGEFVSILGEKHKIIVEKSIRDFISLKEQKIIIESTKDRDYTKLYEYFLKREAEKYFQTKIDELWVLVGIKPTLQVKNLKKTWGICSYTKRKISLNVNLYKQNKKFVEYVILHELTHLLYPNHSKNFYNYIEKYMPDWKERKSIIQI
jgi:predicted metal-dependent hydrolase